MIVRLVLKAIQWLPKKFATWVANEINRQLLDEIKDLKDLKERKKKYRLENVHGSVVLMPMARGGSGVTPHWLCPDCGTYLQRQKRTDQGLDEWNCVGCPRSIFVPSATLPESDSPTRVSLGWIRGDN